MADKRSVVQEIGMDHVRALDLVRVDRAVNADLFGPVAGIKLCLGRSDLGRRPR